jgi:hypothetical protein
MFTHDSEGRFIVAETEKWRAVTKMGGISLD